MTKKSNFEKAVNLSKDKLNFCIGFAAIKEGRGKITAKDANYLLGSVNIDNDIKSLYPSDNRWDYAIGYKSNGIKEKVYFVEVHTALTSEVKTLLAKADALKNWALKKAPELWNVNGKDKKLYWVASGKIKIPSHTPQYRLLANSVIEAPKNFLTLE